MHPIQTVTAAERTRRATLGLDMSDEVWNGEYQMAPAAHWGHGYLQGQVPRLLGPLADARNLLSTGPVNIGEPDNYRVPDHAFHRNLPLGVWNPTATVVVEVLSPGDATFDKIGFYADHGVEEIWIIDPESKTVRCIDPVSSANLEHSVVFDIDIATIAAQIIWP